jgi:hypothetical protein
MWKSCAHEFVCLYLSDLYQNKAFKTWGLWPQGRLIILFCWKGNFKILLQLDQNIAQEGQVPIAYVLTNSEEAIYLGKLTMACLWHQPLKSQNLDFVSAAQVDLMIWRWLTWTQVQRVWYKSQRPRELLIQWERIVTWTKTLKQVWPKHSVHMNKYAWNTIGESKGQRWRNHSMY